MKKLFTLVVMLLTLATITTKAQVEGLDLTAIATYPTTATADLKADQWYVLYNEGRKAWAYGTANQNSSAPMNGAEASQVYKYFIRLVDAGDSKYYIQNGAGQYYKDLIYNSNAGVTTDQTSAGKFTIAQIGEKEPMYIMGTTYVMDSNGSAIVGWSTTPPTSDSGNSAWTFREVSLTSASELTGGALVSYQLSKGGLFRIQNRGNNGSQYLAEASGKGTTKTKSTVASSRMTQMWIVEQNNGTFSLRNAATGNYLQSGTTCTSSKFYWHIQLSPNNTKESDPYIIICNTTPESGKKTCLNLNGGSSGLAMWYYDNDKNSEWTIVPVSSTEVDTATVKANLDKICKTGTFDLEAGCYYQFTNLDNGQLLTEQASDNVIITQESAEDAWNQYWKAIPVEGEEGLVLLQNVYTSRYLNHKATSETSACGGNYSTITSKTNTTRYWTIAEGSYAWETTYNIIEPKKPTTAIGASSEKGSNMSVDATAAQWVLQRVDLTDEQVAKAQQSYEEFQLIYNTSTSILNTRLQRFFSNYSCSALKENMQALTDEELVDTMRASDLPMSIINIALKVKNDTWASREKEFRVYDYEAYSDPTKWNGGSLMGTGYQFSPQTGPTGISVKQGDLLMIFVGANAATGTTLSLSNNERYAVYSSETTLKRGINIYIPDHDGFLFVHHIITNVSKKLADFAPITIHIEGGRVQGYFDITRGHTNADWKDLAENFFQDEIVHMKSYTYEYNMSLSGVKSQLVASEFDQFDTDGCPKAIEGILHRWDFISNNQRHLMGVDQFKDRFNCILSASSSSDGNPYASSYGTYYPGVGTIMNYNHLTRGTENDEGGNYWCIAHETGHIHQSLINQAGDTEVSNNFFSQVCTWLEGSNTGRGGPWKEAQTSFNNGQFKFEYDLWQRCRSYFQLWLYFHLQGHDTEFYQKLFDMFRQTPMTRSRTASSPSSGTTDYLRFAKFCCDAAQADLSEFFQFWGYFVPVKDYEIGDYSNSYVTTTQAEIDEAIAYMHKYEKKLGNILFIDERIEKVPAECPGATDGQMRVATSSHATPGDASEVGELGMYTMFVDNPEYMQYSCVVALGGTRKGQVIISKTSGKGAVGFKVYNSDHKMVYVSNTHTFTLPEELQGQPIYIMAALGDGTDRLLYDPKDISAVEDAATVANGATQFDPAQPCYTLDGQMVAQPAKGQIYIQNGVKYRY